MSLAPYRAPAPLVPGEVAGFDDVEAAVAMIAAGGSAVVVDDEDRENEGDLIASAQLATPLVLGQMVRRTSGVICVPLTPDHAARLDLPPMRTVNEDPKGTAYTVSCDAVAGISTGISAADRAATARVLGDPHASAADLTRPGHMFPLVAVPGGVRSRAGHTEAAVDLNALAGLSPVGLIAEVVHDDGSMMRLPDLQLLAAADGLPLLTIERLAAYLDARDAQRAGGPVGEDGEEPARPAALTLDRAAHVLPEIQRVSEPVSLPTEHGLFTAQVWRILGTEHLTLSVPVPPGPEDPLVRVHSECLTGDVLGSHRCDCGEQLALSLDRITHEGGTLVYVRDHEGRGIGLLNKLRAYHLQEQGADTVEANEALGLPVEARDYAPAAAVLSALGIDRLRLLTNNPAKVEALEGLGLEVSAVVSVEVPPRPENHRYLATKRDRMRHHLDQVDGSTVL